MTNATATMTSPTETEIALAIMQRDHFGVSSADDALHEAICDDSGSINVNMVDSSFSYEYWGFSGVHRQYDAEADGGGTVNLEWYEINEGEAIPEVPAETSTRLFVTCGDDEVEVEVMASLVKMAITREETTVKLGSCTYHRTVWTVTATYEWEAR